MRPLRRSPTDCVVVSPTTSPSSSGTAAASANRTRTGAHRSPYRVGWNEARSVVAGSVVRPSMAKTRPVARETAPREATTSGTSSLGAPEASTTTWMGRHGDHATGTVRPFAVSWVSRNAYDALVALGTGAVPSGAAASSNPGVGWSLWITSGVGSFAPDMFTTTPDPSGPSRAESRIPAHHCMPRITRSAATNIATTHSQVDDRTAASGRRSYGPG